MAVVCTSSGLVSLGTVGAIAWWLSAMAAWPLLASTWEVKGQGSKRKELVRRRRMAVRWSLSAWSRELLQGAEPLGEFAGPMWGVA